MFSRWRRLEWVLKSGNDRCSVSSWGGPAHMWAGAGQQTDSVCCLTSAASALEGGASPSGPPSVPDGVRFMKEDMGSHWNL